MTEFKNPLLRKAVPDHHPVHRAITNETWLDDSGHRATYLAFMLRQFTCRECDGVGCEACDKGKIWEEGVSVVLPIYKVQTIPNSDQYKAIRIAVRDIHASEFGLQVVEKSSDPEAAEIMNLPVPATRQLRRLAQQAGTDLALQSQVKWVMPEATQALDEESRE